MVTDQNNLDLLDDEPLIDFCQLFECQVARTPNAVAVYFEEDSFTYAQLNNASNRIARFLLSFEPTSEQRIGVCLDRSFDAIAAMLGIFKAGCAFVPLDPEFPIDRLAYIVDDAEIGQILCDDSYRTLFNKHSNNPTVLNPDEVYQDSSDATNPSTLIAPRDLAYIMYTSGSTGKPKGVQIEHRSLATYCFADIDLYKVVPDDRTLQFSTLNFDIAIEEIFPPLLTGGSVVVRPRERCTAHNELSTIVERYGVTAIHLATAYWHEWVDLMVATKAKVPASIRLMVVTGEKVSAEHFRRWNKICDHEVLWCNAYGPTEATVTATVFIPDSGWDGDNMPIGKPLKRYDALIFNSDGHPVADGETGELLIGGPALARGYLNRPELNAKAFLSLPLDSCEQEQRFYRTGDLARWLPNGDIEFGGRIDHQIKLGSYRIEPGEIEAAINHHPQVLESLITYDEIEGKKYLIAYVAQGSNQIDPSDLATHLRSSLPAYMVPTRFAFVATFPKTINGKIDRKALPSPDQSFVARGSDYIAASTDLEKQLSDIWADVLNVPNVGIHDDFFALGGSSLLVTRVITQISSQLDVEIPVRDFFANPTIASIARHISMLITRHVSNSSGVITSDPTTDAGGIQLSRNLRKKLPTVEPAYFKSGGYDLFGVRYLPVETSLDHAVLICPPYGHEYSRAHRNLQQLAIQLSQRGCHVLRFDYSATGNSSGECSEANPTAWRNDIQSAAKHLRAASGTFRLSIVGLRLGATLASTCTVPDVDSLVLWDPISDGAMMCQMLDRMHERGLSNFSRFNTVRKRSELDQAYGYVMTPEKRAGLDGLTLRTATQSARRKCVIASREYAEDEALQDLPIHWEFRSTNDEISWHHADYAERAFSSPEAFSSIVSILAEGKNA